MITLALRTFPLLRAGYAVVLLCIPGALIGACTGQPASKTDRRIARVLGARHLTQAVLMARTSSATALGIGSAVDLAHAASMVALAAGDHAMRPAELADGLIAASFAATGTVLAAASASGKQA